jgi:hypothetical protein
MEIGACPFPPITGTTVSKRIAEEIIDYYNRHDETQRLRSRGGATAAGIIAALWLGGVLFDLDLRLPYLVGAVAMVVGFVVSLVWKTGREMP